MVSTSYYPDTGTLKFIVEEGKISESDHVHPYLLVDYGTEGNILQFDIEYAQKILYDFFPDKHEYFCELTPEKKLS